MDSNASFSIFLSFARAMDPLHELVKVVARSFYSDAHVVVLDMLLREQV